MGRKIKYNQIKPGMDLKVTYYNDKGREKAVFYGYIPEDGNRGGEGQYIMYINKVDKNANFIDIEERNDIDFRPDYVVAEKI